VGFGVFRFHFQHFLLVIPQRGAADEDVFEKSWFVEQRVGGKKATQ